MNTIKKVTHTRLLPWAIVLALLLVGTGVVSSQYSYGVQQHSHSVALQKKVTKYTAELATTKKNLQKAQLTGVTCADEAKDWNTAYVALAHMLADFDFSDATVANMEALEQTAYADTCLVPAGGDNVTVVPPSA